MFPMVDMQTMYPEFVWLNVLINHMETLQLGTVSDIVQLAGMHTLLLIYVF